MQTQPILTTAKPIAKARNLLLIGLAIGAVSYYILFGSVQQGIVHTFGWIFMVCALLCIYGVFTLNSLAIYDDRLEMEYLMGLPKKTIQRKDITQWEEREMKGYYGTYGKTRVRLSYLLTLHTASGKVRFPSANYDNYDQIKAELTSGKAKVV